MVAFFYFPATLTPYASYAKRLLVVDKLDLDSICPPLSRGTDFFHSENLASCWELIFATFRGSCPRNPVAQHAVISLFVKHVADKQQFMSSPCTSSSHAISVQAFRWRSEKKTEKKLNNEAYGQGNGRQSFFTVLCYH